MLVCLAGGCACEALPTLALVIFYNPKIDATPLRSKSLLGDVTMAFRLPFGINEPRRFASDGMNCLLISCEHIILSTPL